MRSHSQVVAKVSVQPIHSFLRESMDQSHIRQILGALYPYFIFIITMGEEVKTSSATCFTNIVIVIGLLI